MSAGVPEPDSRGWTVLGGYLGAGKTTLLNDVLAATAGRRIAVVVNDFGSINVDADLVSATGQDTLELADGCVCCSLSDGMAAVLERIRAIEPAPEHVLVEVSGVGDPLAVARWGDHPGFRRNGVVVCADVESVRDRARDRWVGDTVLRQLRGADTVVLTRTDLVAAHRTEAVAAWVATVAPHAEVLWDRQAVLARLEVGYGSATPAGTQEPDQHLSRHRSWSVVGPGPVDASALVAVLADLPPDVVRVKGRVRTSADPSRWTVVQLAGARVAYDDGGPVAGPGLRSSLVVVCAGDRSGDPPVVGKLRGLLGGDD